MTSSILRRTARRSAASLAVLVLSAGALSACGGDDTDSAATDSSSDSSESAAPDATAAPSEDSGDDTEESDDSGDDSGGTSTEDFCGAYTAYFAEIQKAGLGGDDNIVPTIKKFAEALSEVGAPDDMPEDARRGYELSTGAAEDLPDDASLEDLATLSGDYSAEEQADGAAFATYVTTTCPDLLSSFTQAPS